ncbi:hypothetical protein C8F01DRAFT_262821 [Mycena amicta]|nr:hypothetical protein C8F01DRAFT_262821 [Mycena amicta]
MQCPHTNAGARNVPYSEMKKAPAASIYLGHVFSVFCFVAAFNLNRILLLLLSLWPHGGRGSDPSDWIGLDWIGTAENGSPQIVSSSCNLTLLRLHALTATNGSSQISQSAAHFNRTLSVSFHSAVQWFSGGCAPSQRIRPKRPIIGGRGRRRLR